MLALVGIGLDTGDISAKAIDIIKVSDTVLIDCYTSIIPEGAIEFIERECGRKIRKIERSDMEEKAGATLEPAKNGLLTILVPGDPLIATTHHILLIEAARLGITYDVVHAPSILSAAIGESGLDVYRFGPTTTVPFWTDKYKPKSFLDTISGNINNGQHTLALFDIRDGVPMKIKEAYGIITSAQEGGKKVLDDKTMVIFLTGIGTDARRVVYTEFRSASRIKQDSPAASCMIVPCKPSFAEEEMLRLFYNSAPDY